ncbi:MAG: sugar transferase [Myxococcota bacterium]
MNSTIILIIVGALGALVLAPYALYPLAIRLVPKRRRPETTRSDERRGERPLVSVLVPACNEAEHIEDKLRNTFALAWPAERLEVVVCDDGSTDDTAARAEAFGDPRVRLLRNGERRGKAVTLGRLASAARGDLLLLTDASAEMAPDALAILAAAMEDPEVGLACARYVVQADLDEPKEENGEASYWRGETHIRKLEAERDMLVAGSGAAYVIRPRLMPTLPADTINDDWVIPLEVRASGHRVAWCPDARVGDAPTKDLATMFRRWQRIACGNWQMLWRYRHLFWRGGRLVLPLGRKALKTLGAPMLVVMLAVLVAGAWTWRALLPVPLAGGAVLTLGALSVFVPDRGVGRSRVFRLARLGVVAQTAYLMGMIRFLTGARTGLWARPAARRRDDLSCPAPAPASVRFAKRTFDLVASVAALLLLWPVMLAIAVIIKLDSKGPVLYRQTRLRCDAHGRPVEFPMLKFRSMCEDAEAGGGPVWARKNDARVTRVGRVLRKHRLDELPQFVNILKGEMSLVGPRPERRLIATQLEDRFPGYDDRHLVQRPGITGWAQVQRGYDSSIEAVGEKLAHDLVYIAHLYRLSTYLKMEALVVVKTFRVLITGKGAQ